MVTFVNFFTDERAKKSDGVAYTALFRRRGNDTDFSDLLQFSLKGCQTRCINAVIICQQNQHGQMGSKRLRAILAANSILIGTLWFCNNHGHKYCVENKLRIVPQAAKWLVYLLVLPLVNSYNAPFPEPAC